MAEKVADPFGILHIGLPARDCFHVLRVYDKEFDVFRLEQVHNWLPVHAGALHGYVGATVFLNPFDELEKIDGVGAERLNLLSFRCNDASCDALLVNIQTACPFNKNIHKTHLSTAIY